MNATLFGNEISRRFEKKRVIAGMIYQGIGLASSAESNVGPMYTSGSTSFAHEEVPEANLQESKTTEHVGYVGFHQVFPPTALESPFIGQNREKPYMPYINTSIVNMPEPASKGNGEQKNMDSQPYMNPTSDRQYVETVDGLGYLTGNQREQDVSFFSEDKRERLRYKIGVVILNDGVERFYYPQNTWEARPEAIQAYEQSCGVQR
jgi:hypothetical protein